MAPRFLLPALCLAFASAPLAAQVTTTLTLTPGANALQVFTSIPFYQGAPYSTGSDVTQWTGTITVQLDNAFAPTSMTIIAANLVAQDSGILPPPTTPLLPANYGFNYTNSPGLLAVAIRSTQATLASTPLPLAGGAGSYGFAPAGVSLAFTNGFVDNRHRTIPENTRRDPLPTNPLADASASQGTLALNGSILSLQIPLDSTFAVVLHGDGGTVRDTATFRLVGTLTATGQIPEPSTWALAALGLSGLAVGLRQRKK